jgi:hypothetical protein
MLKRIHIKYVALLLLRKLVAGEQRNTIKPRKEAHVLRNPDATRGQEDNKNPRIK